LVQKVQYVQCVQKVGGFCLPMLVLSPIIKVCPLPYSLFLVFYSLFPSVFAPLRALREIKNVQKVGGFCLPM
jgi:hypothetical protein